MSDDARQHGRQQARHDAGCDDDGFDLRWEIAELRAEVPVRAVWRDALEREIAAERRLRAMRVSPVSGTRRLAIAAAIAGMMLGAGGTAMYARYQGGHSAGTGVRFALTAPGVGRVSLVGDFNGWNAQATQLERSRDGRTWSVELPLESGHHTYAFVVDGVIVPDPSAPPAVEDDFGTPSSLVLVSNTGR